MLGIVTSCRRAGKLFKIQPQFPKYNIRHAHSDEEIERKQQNDEQTKRFQNLIEQISKIQSQKGKKTVHQFMFFFQIFIQARGFLDLTSKLILYPEKSVYNWY
jgi:hypothetical protein